MNVQMDAKREKRVRAAVKPGDPFALDDLMTQLCADAADRATFSGIVADEYRRRLKAMPRVEMLELYRRFYEDATDANKDWLLGELLESIEAERN